MRKLGGASPVPPLTSGHFQRNVLTAFLISQFVVTDRDNVAAIQTIPNLQLFVAPAGQPH
jgi:hypothetical protein